MTTSKEQDRAKGIEALKYFHDFSKINYPFKYNISFDELVRIIDTRGKGSIAGLGLGIFVTNTPKSKVEDAMLSLAREAKGDIPRTNNAFNMALSDRLQEIDFDAIKEITSESAKDLANISSGIGDKVIQGVNGVFDLVGGAKVVIPVTLGLYIVSKNYFNSRRKKS